MIFFLIFIECFWKVVDSTMLNAQMQVSDWLTWQAKVYIYSAGEGHCDSSWPRVFRGETSKVLRRDFTELHHTVFPKRKCIPHTVNFYKIYRVFTKRTRCAFPLRVFQRYNVVKHFTNGFFVERSGWMICKWQFILAVEDVWWPRFRL